MKSIIPLVTLLIVIACTDQQADKTIKVSVNNSTIENPFTYSHHVILSTPDDILLGEIQKLQLIGGKIYIMDNQRKSVFCFDSQGNYLRHLTKQGHSEKEYIRIEDFEVDNENNIYIFDSEQKKIIMYDLAGNFINSQPAIGGIAFKLLSDGLVAYNRGNGAASIIKDSDQKLYNYACARGMDIEINAVPFDTAIEGRRLFLSQTKNLFYEWDRDIFMSSMLNNTIYKISKHNGHIEPYVIFETDNALARAHGKELLNLTNDIIDGRSASTPYNFQKNENLMMIMYNYDMRPHTFIYDEKTGTSANGIISSNKYGLPFSPISYLDSDDSGEIITLLEPHSIQLLLKLSENKGLDTILLKELQQLSNQNDNTILIFNNWPKSL
jgi:hypothetical protein